MAKVKAILSRVDVEVSSGISAEGALFQDNLAALDSRMTFRKAHFSSGHDLKDFAEKLGIELKTGEIEQ